MLDTPHAKSSSDTAVEDLKSEAEYRTILQKIGNQINVARDLDDIFIELNQDVTDLFSAERMTIFVVDGVKRELVSRYKTGDELAEIRIPVNKESLAGYAALTHSLLNISNAYDDGELCGIDEDLKFDKSWDQKTGFRTKQVLVYP